MAVTVKLYKYAGDPGTVDKTLDETTAISCSCEFRAEQDVLNPELTVSGGNLSEYNYMYIDRYKRYYYINVSTFPTGKWLIHGHVDVLKTYTAGIHGLTGTVTRSETLANGYLPDERYKAKGYKAIVTKSFPAGVNNDSIILMTVG